MSLSFKEGLERDWLCLFSLFFAPFLLLFQNKARRECVFVFARIAIFALPAPTILAFFDGLNEEFTDNV